MDRSQSAPPAPAIVPEGEQDESADTSLDIIKALPLEKRIAQLMLVSTKGLMRPDSTERQLLRDFPPGGIIIPVITRPGNGSDQVKTLRSLPIETQAGIPLFIGTDFFASSKDRINPGLTFRSTPSLLAIASAGISGDTLALSQVVAGDLKTMGFNLHFGPTLQLANQLASSKGTLHAFGSRPDMAMEFADQFASAMKENGILWAPKGFPGGGANRNRSEPAVLLTPKSLLRTLDVAPYEAAIRAGVDILHVGNTLVPAIDKTLPASLSPVVMQGLLRDILGYEGIIVAGPMDAPDIAAAYTPSEAVQLALRAGADMIYWSSVGPNLMRAIAETTMAVHRGELHEILIDQALRRIIETKEEYGLIEYPVPEDKAASNIEKGLSKYEGAYRIERQSVTLARNINNILPLGEETSQPIGITGVQGVEELADALEDGYFKRVARQRITSAIHATRIQDFEIDRLLRGSARLRTVVCILSDAVDMKSQIRLLQALKSRGSRVVAVLVGFPEILPDIQMVDAIVLTYAEAPRLDDSMKAVAAILAGDAPIQVLPPLRALIRKVNEEISFNVYDVIRSPTGRLPVTMSESHKEGFSVSYRPTLSIKSVSWDFGDGAKGREMIATHAFRKPGTYRVTLEISDDNGDKTSGQFDIVVQ